MPRLSISNIFDAAKAKATKAGAELGDLVDTFGQLVKELVPTLNGGLTFTQNLNCEAKVVDLLSDTDQVVSKAEGKVLTDVIPSRVVSTDVVLDTFNWWLDNEGKLRVKAGFLKDRAIADVSGSNCVTGTVPTTKTQLRLLLFYG